MKDPFDAIPHRSAVMQAVVRQAREAARRDDPVLLKGEWGVGKATLARAIHDASDRRNEHFATLDCRHCHPLLFDTELFGFYRGSSVKAAHHWREGFLEAASGGTLLLRGVGSLPATTQSKLLAFLETGIVITQQVPDRRSVEVRTDIRVMATSDAESDAEVDSDRFNPLLRDRLSAFTLHVPALRERLDDIEVLATYLINHLPGAPVGREPMALSPNVLAYLLATPWPSNVCELERLLHAAAAAAYGRLRIELDDLSLP